MLKACGIALGYGGKTLVEGLNFSLEAGQICAVMGHNGAGKSTLVRTLLGLQPPLAGWFDWAGGQPCDMAYLGQTSERDHQFPIRVKDVVAMGVWKGLGFWTGIDRANADRVDYALARTSLTEMADRPLYECSSGQLQRCYFARAIAQDAPVLILDEPVSAIDQTTESRLIEIIREWRNEGRSIMIVLHDISSVIGISDSCLLLGAGRALFGRTDDIITTENLIFHNYLTAAQAQWLSLLQNKGAGDV